MTLPWIILAALIWLSIVGLIIAIIVICICVHELRKLIAQVRGMIKKVSSKDLNLEVADPDDETGEVFVAPGWEDGIENPRD